MVESQEFHIGTVLSILTDKLLSPKHIGGVYEILEYMSGEKGLMTHQLIRVSDEVKPYLVQQHPELAKVVVPDGLNDWDSVFGWMDTELYDKFGEMIPVSPIPKEAHTMIDPISELSMRAPHMKIVVVEPEED